MNGRTPGARALSIVTAALAATTLTLVAVQAQEGPNRRVANVGTVDLSRVFRKFPLTRQLARELREWKIAKEKAIEEKRAELTSARDTLVAADGAAAKNAHAVLMGANREMVELQQDLSANYDKRLLENDRVVYEKIRAAVAAVREAEDLDLVLQRLDDEIAAETVAQQAVNIRLRTLLESSPRLDITDLVLAELERKSQ